MRNRSGAPGSALPDAGEAGRDQLEFWRVPQPPLQGDRPLARASGGIGAAHRLDPLQLSLEVAGAARSGAVAGEGREP
jgi:hypothetical protein